MSTAVVHQPTQALEKANGVRSFRAALKAELRARGPSEAPRLAAQHVLDPPPELASMRVAQLLLAVPKLGPTRAQKLCRRAGVRDGQELGCLTDRQRFALARELAQ